MRYMGIDYGLRRIGVAVADGETGIAIARSTIVRQDDAQAIREAAAAIRDEKIDAVIVGIALDSAGRNTAMSDAARVFGEALGTGAGVPVFFENEMLTSRMAHGAGMRGDAIDASSAAIILQSFLDKNPHHRTKIAG
jgi:putative Holliday junction resolvase